MLHWTEDKRSSGAVSALLLAVILAVAIVLRFQDLDRTSLWYDEAVSWGQSNGSFADLLKAVAADNYPPLHNVILWLTMPVIGDSETALRLPSAVLGVLAVWLVYLIGKHLGGRETGLTAAALLAISPLHIWYSTEARMYALLAACGLAFLLAALKTFRDPSIVRVTLLAATSALFLYSHVYALFGFAGAGLVCAIYAALDFYRTRSLIRSGAVYACLGMSAGAFLFLPWLYILLQRARSVADTGFWIAYPDLQFLETLVFGLSGSIALFWLLTGLAAAGVFAAVFKPAFQQERMALDLRAVLVCLGYTLGPPLLAFVYSVLLQPILFDRYLIAAWPGLVVLGALGATLLSRRLGAVVLVGAALALTYPQLSFTLNEKIRPEWRDLAAYYRANSAAEDRLLLYKGFAAPALAYYLRGDDRFVPIETIEGLEVSSKTHPPGATWLLLCHSNEQETAEAKEIFFTRGGETAAQGFGWGASGLRLLKSGPTNQQSMHQNRDDST